MIDDSKRARSTVSLLPVATGPIRSPLDWIGVAVSRDLLLHLWTRPRPFTQLIENT